MSHGEVMEGGQPGGWKWSGQVDLNHRPHGPEPCALTRLSYAPIGRDADSRGSASEASNRPRRGAIPARTESPVGSVRSVSHDQTLHFSALCGCGAALRAA